MVHLRQQIICKVRAGSKGFATTIKEVIDDGTRVKPGQLLMVLDDSALRDQEEAQSITFLTATANKVAAEKNYEIQVKENESAIAQAQTVYTLSEIELDKLTGFAPDPSLLALSAEYVRMSLEFAKVPEGAAASRKIFLAWHAFESIKLALRLFKRREFVASARTSLDLVRHNPFWIVHFGRAIALRARVRALDRN